MTRCLILMKQFVPFITEINRWTVTQCKIPSPKKGQFYAPIITTVEAHSHGERRTTFRPLKNLTGLFVPKGPFNIFALFTPNFEQMHPKILERLRWFRVNQTPKKVERSVRAVWTQPETTYRPTPISGRSFCTAWSLRWKRSSARTNRILSPISDWERKIYLIESLYNLENFTAVLSS